MNYNRDFLENAHRYCNSNYEQAMESGLCGCFYCCRTFNPQEITEWVDDKGTFTAIFLIAVLIVLFVVNLDFQ